MSLFVYRERLRQGMSRRRPSSGKRQNRLKGLSTSGHHPPRVSRPSSSVPELPPPSLQKQQYWIFSPLLPCVLWNLRSPPLSELSLFLAEEEELKIDGKMDLSPIHINSAKAGPSLCRSGRWMESTWTTKTAVVTTNEVGWWLAGPYTRNRPIRVWQPRIGTFHKYWLPR